MTISERAVLFLGAGFSIPAGIPSQAELLRRIHELTPTLGESDEAIRFQDAKTVVEAFLESVFGRCAPSGGGRPWWEAELEDIYSVLDRALSEDDLLPPYRHEELYAVRNSLDTCITYAIGSATPRVASLYESIYDELCRLHDDWATISTNWDLLWDNTLQERVRHAGKTVDYGVPTRSMNDATLHLPGGPLLYKLHGSLNWASCACCHGLFAGTDGDRWIPQLTPAPCPRCGVPKENGSELMSSPLRTLIITPTMLKTIKNPIVQMVYDEAFTLLRRASVVVFVGYSLPAADHNLRYLLRRGISRDAKVKVVLRDPGAKDVFRRYQSLLGLPDEALWAEGLESYFKIP